MKKFILALSIGAVTAVAASAAEYSVFRVCEDQHVLKTSDGADAGHVEYLVVDPGEHRVVSTIVTGGVLADRTIAVPVDDFVYGSGREVTLRTITRERLVSAPVIEQTQITAIRSGRFEPAVVERSRSYFNVNVDASRTTVNQRNIEGRTRTEADVNVRDRATTSTERERMRDGNRTGASATATTRETESARTPGDRNDRNDPRTGPNARTSTKAGANERPGTTATESNKPQTNPPSAENADPKARNNRAEGREKAGNAREQNANRPGANNQNNPSETPARTESRSEGEKGSTKAGAKGENAERPSSAASEARSRATEKAGAAEKAATDKAHGAEKAATEHARGAEKAATEKAGGAEKSRGNARPPAGESSSSKGEKNQ